MTSTVSRRIVRLGGASTRADLCRATSRRQHGGSEVAVDSPHCAPQTTRRGFPLLPTVVAPAAIFQVAPTLVTSTRADHVEKAALAPATS